MKTGTRLLLAFGTAVAVAALIGLVALVSSRSLLADLDSIARRDYPVAEAIADLRQSAATISFGSTTLFNRLLRDSELRRSLFTELDSSLGAVANDRQVIAALKPTGEVARTWEAALPVLERWTARARSVRDRLAEYDALLERSADAESQEVAEAYFQTWTVWVEYLADARALSAALDEVAGATRLAVAATRDRADGNATRMKRLTLAALLAGTAALALLGLLLSRRTARAISAVVGEASRLRDAVAAGSLEVRGEPGRTDSELAPIVYGINSIIDALQMSEDKFAKAFHSSAVPTAITSLDEGRYLEVNDATVAITEYSRSELLGRTPLEVGVWPQSLAGSRLLVREALLAGKSVHDVEQIFRAKSGREHVGMLSAQPIRLGGQRCVLSTVTIVTDLKEQEARLRERNRELSLLSAITAGTVDELEPEAVLELACRELAAALEVPAVGAGLVTEDLSAVEIVAVAGAVGHVLVGASFKTFGAVTTARRPIAFEDVLAEPNLALLHDAARATGVRGLLVLPLVSDGRTQGWLGLAAPEGRRLSDSERSLAWNAAQQVAAALGRARAAQARRRLEAAVVQTPTSIIITDVDGRIQYVNPAFERHTGYSKAEVLGQTPRLLKSGKQSAATYRELWTRILAGEVWSGRLVNRTKAGKLFVDDTIIAPVRDAAGAIRNFVSVRRDVTQELALEQQLAESQRLESVARLAGGIAHDFNNLLTVISGCTDLLQRDLSESGKVNPDDLGEIAAAADRAKDLTHKLLAFARRQVFEPVPLDLNAVVREAEKLLRRLLDEDILMKTELAGGLWTVRCDRAQLEQILFNLTVNARDAMPEGGQLTLATSNVELGPADGLAWPDVAPGPYVMLAVHDTGIGMSDAVREKVFEPFFTTKPPGKGTGLGLATVYGIVKQSGGGVRALSEPGRGTRFEVLLPRHAGEAWPKSDAVATPLQRARPAESVLVVEDDPSVRAVTTRFLRSGGYDVLGAASAAEAEALVERHSGRIDLLVTDVVMPGMDGHRLASRLREARPLLPVLFVSGHAHDVLANHGVADASLDLLQKPFTCEALLARVRQALDRG